MEEISGLKVQAFVDFVDEKDKQVLDAEMEQYEEKVSERQKQIEEEQKKKKEEEDKKKAEEKKKKLEELRKLRAVVDKGRINAEK